LPYHKNLSSHSYMAFSYGCCTESWVLTRPLVGDGCKPLTNALINYGVACMEEEEEQFLVTID
jgi:hypothetical protein